MTRVRRAHSFVLDLNDGQRSALEQMADGRRAAYNFALALDRDLYAADLPPADFEDLEPGYEQPRWNERRSASHYDLNKAWPPAWRELTPWNRAAGVPAQIAFADYTKARDAAIKRRRGFPRFRSRYDPSQGFSTRGVSVTGDAIKVPNIERPLRVAGSTRRLRWFLEHTAGTIQLAHLLRPGVRASWRCVVIVEIDQSDISAHTGPVVGLDLGISHFLTLSSGETVANPRILNGALRRLRSAQKSATRSEQTRQARETAARSTGALAANRRLPKSHRHEAKEAVVTRLHARVAALRAEFHHRVANDLVDRFSAIGIEDLNIAGMKRNRSLARHISDVGWASFLRILAYKADAASVEIVRAGRWFPSSQRCADCGTINKVVKNLNIRRWVCSACGVIHDRDHNSARNLAPSARQIALARSVRVAERQQQAKRRQSQRDRAAKATATKKAARLANHEAKIARHASETKTPAGTPSVGNARRGPLRPKMRTTVFAAVARTETPLSREEARTAAAGLPTLLIDSGLSLGAPGSPVLHGTG